VWQFAGPNNKWNLSMTVREANAGRGLGGRGGAAYFGTKGTMVQAGSMIAVWIFGLVALARSDPKTVSILVDSLGGNA
jgi:hypothetical protein